MSDSFDDWLDQAKNVHKIQRKAVKAGVKLGRLQDVGVFLIQDGSAPSRVLNSPIQIIGEDAWQEKSTAFHAALAAIESGQMKTTAKPEKSPGGVMKVSRG